jgi:hypothetical protein
MAGRAPLLPEDSMALVIAAASDQPDTTSNHQEVPQLTAP